MNIIVKILTLADMGKNRIKITLKDGTVLVGTAFDAVELDRYDEDGSVLWTVPIKTADGDTEWADEDLIESVELAE